MADNNKFDKIKYDNQYIKDHFKQMKIAIKPEIFDDIKEAAAKEGKTVTQYIIDVHFEHKGKL
jgi:hypothetical protein